MGELKRFENDLRNNKDLEKRLNDIFRQIAADDPSGNDGELMVRAAKELGYEITLAELEQARAEAEQLDPDELEAAAGGVVHYRSCSSDYVCTAVVNAATSDEYGHDGWCVTAWHCLAATLHTESKDKDILCWADYQCVVIQH